MRNRRGLTRSYRIAVPEVEMAPSITWSLRLLAVYSKGREVKVEAV